MCGRYKIEEHWQAYCKLAYFDWNDPPFPTENPFKVHSDEVFPSDRIPIVRVNEAADARRPEGSWPDGKRFVFWISIP